MLPLLVRVLSVCRSSSISGNLSLCPVGGKPGSADAVVSWLDRSRMPDVQRRGRRCRHRERNDDGQATS